MYVYVCMYVCMYVCLYVCMCVCVCMYVCMCVCMYVCMYVCVYVCMDVCTYVCMYVCMYVYADSSTKLTTAKSNPHPVCHNESHFCHFGMCALTDNYTKFLFKKGGKFTKILLERSVYEES